MMIFISTEVMFFTALLASYIVLRYSGENTWPTNSQVHVHLWIGVVNTVILLGSCLALSFSKRAAGKDNPSTAKRWLLITILLGTIFLGIKGFEYFDKIQHGLYPSGNGTTIFERADEQYLSRTAAELSETITMLETDAGLKKTAEEEQQLERLRMVQSGLVNWTQFKVSRESDRLMRQRSIESLAHQVYPLAENAQLDQFLADELNEVRREAKAGEQRVKQIETELSVVQAELKRLLPLRESGEADIEDQFAKQSQTADDLTKQITISRGELNPIQQRLAAIDQMPEGEGLNEALGIKLPMVIPQGKTWMNTYYLLTGFHALHMLAGLLVLIWWVGLRLGRDRVHLLENFGIYWHFVDLVWLTIFAIIYLNLTI